MKILQMIPAFHPAMAYGGTVAVSYQLSRELVRRGHEITVYTSDALDKNHRQKDKFVEMEGIQVYYFKNLSNRLAWRRMVFNPSMFHQLRKEIKNFDIIHLHGFRSFQNILVHYYAKKYSIPYVLQAHGSVLPFFAKQRLKRVYDQVWGNNILKDASKVIALTKTEAEQYKMMGVDEAKIEIIPNGIDLSKYDDLPEMGNFRGNYSITDDEKVILYLGRIHKIKGVDLLVEAFADLVKELDGVKLVIAGPDDGFLPTLKAQIENLNIDNRVVFTGPLYGNDKLEAYVDADVYVLPSVYEIFGVTPLEACACGTPVIVTDRCGIADIIDGNVGRVVEYNKDQLRNAVFEMLEDDELRDRFGEEGMRFVRAEFGWGEIVKNVEELYKDCINGKVE